MHRCLDTKRTLADSVDSELASGNIRVLNLVLVNWHKQHAVTKWNGVGYQNFITSNKVCNLFIGMKVKE